MDSPISIPIFLIFTPAGTNFCRDLSASLIVAWTSYDGTNLGALKIIRTHTNGGSRGGNPVMPPKARKRGHHNVWPQKFPKTFIFYLYFFSNWIWVNPKHSEFNPWSSQFWGYPVCQFWDLVLHCPPPQKKKKPAAGSASALSTHERTCFLLYIKTVSFLWMNFIAFESRCSLPLMPSHPIRTYANGWSFSEKAGGAKWVIDWMFCYA